MFTPENSVLTDLYGRLEETMTVLLIALCLISITLVVLSNRIVRLSKRVTERELVIKIETMGMKRVKRGE